MGYRLFRLNILLISLALLFTACNRVGGTLSSLDDISKANIAILNSSISEEEFQKQFPDAKALQFKSSSDFLLSLAVGKCDVGLAETNEGAYILNNSTDYGAVLNGVSDSLVFIVHKKLLPGKAVEAAEDGFINESIDRINRSLISDNYWKLIINGLSVTVSIFFFGVIFAMALAITVIWMGYKQKFKRLAKYIFYFIRTIHDVPSVVLIFFFYYIIFASVNISGVIVCIIALGVYSSGSFMNVINVHLKQVDPTQHYAAEMLGLNGWKKYRYVILPQAVKPMLPLLASESKVLLRATTYAGYISQVDLVKVTEIIRNQTYDVLVPLLFVSLVFLLLSWLIEEALSALYNILFIYVKN